MGYKYFGIKNHNKMNREKPSRDCLEGMSPSEFKTYLKCKGLNVPKDFFKRSGLLEHKNRMIRFRFQENSKVSVDISCDLENFDRWANSTEKTVPLDELIVII